MISAMRTGPDERLRDDPAGGDDPCADAAAHELREGGVAVVAMPELPWSALRDEALAMQAARATSRRGRASWCCS